MDIIADMEAELAAGLRARETASFRETLASLGGVMAAWRDPASGSRS